MQPRLHCQHGQPCPHLRGAILDKTAQIIDARQDEFAKALA